MSVEAHLEFRLLKYILALAEAGTFTAAAANLHVAQSAISAQITGLEDVLHVKLFDRNRNNALTLEGAILVNFARDALQGRKDVIAAIHAVRAGALLPLRLGFSPLIEKDLLGTVTQIYRKLLPNCAVELSGEKTDELEEGVQKGALDAALVTLPIGDDKLHVQLLTREPLRVCLREDDPAAQSKAVPVSALHNKLSLFAYPVNHPLAYAQLLEALDEFGVTPRPSKPTLMMDHVQLLIQQEQCVALVRQNCQLLNGLVARPIAGVNWTIDSAIISKTDRPHPAVPLLLRELTKQFSPAIEIYDSGEHHYATPHKTAQHATHRFTEQQLGLFAGHNTPDERGHIPKR